jgi:hypothetical protein
MFDKKIFFVICGILLLLPGAQALQMLEPIMIETTENKAIEIGTVAPEEYFLISFFLEDIKKYDVITTDNYGANYLFFENTQKTKESIYTVVKIKENTSGEQQVKIILKNTETGKTESAYLKMTISSNAISAFVMPYASESKFGVKKEVTVKVINKSITTKKITVSSNLPNTWFDSKDTGKIKKEVVVVLQPSASVDVNYSYIPKVIGDRDFELYVYTEAIPQAGIFHTSTFFNKVLFERNTEKMHIFVKKDLAALYAANLYNFPTFALNSIPAYFFNNIIRIVAE